MILVAPHPPNSEEGQQHSRLSPAKSPYGSNAVKKRAYESLVRPILEYSGVVWDPHTAVENNTLKMVPRRYARYVCNDYGRTSSVTSMLNNIGWEQLEERDAKSHVTMLYRIVDDLVDIPATDHLL